MIKVLKTLGIGLIAFVIGVLILGIIAAACDLLNGAGFVTLIALVGLLALFGTLYVLGSLVEEYIEERK